MHNRAHSIMIYPVAYHRGYEVVSRINVINETVQINSTDK